MSAPRDREALESVAFARRVIRAAGRTIADADEFELAELVALRADLEAAIRVAVQGQRSRRSWAYIGDALGITRQSAQARYGTPPVSQSAPAVASHPRA